MSKIVDAAIEEDPNLATPPPDPAAAVVDAPTEPVDFDELALREAQAAVEAEEAAAAAPPAAAPKVEPAPAAAAAPKPAAAAPAAAKPAAAAAAPKPALNREQRLAQALQEERDKNAFLEGRLAEKGPAAAAPAAAKQEAPPAPPKKTAEELEEEMLVLSDRLERAEIGMSDFTKANNALMRAHREATVAEAREEAQALIRESEEAGWKDTLEAQDRQRDKMVEIDILKKPDIIALRQAALSALEEEGRPITSGHPRETNRLRAKIAEMAVPYAQARYGAEALRARAAEKGLTFGRTPAQLRAVSGSTTQPQSAAPAAPAPAAAPKPSQAAARESKLALAGSHPPDIRNLGSAATRTEVTDADIMTMTEEDIDALPAALKAKYLGLG